MAVARGARKRRTPVLRDRYRAVARSAARRRPRAHPRVLDIALLAAGAVMLLVVLPVVGGAIGSGAGTVADSLGSAIANVLPGGGSEALQLPSPGGVVSAGPIVETLPNFTADPQLRVQGRVPSFAVQSGRNVDVALNGAIAGSVPLDSVGSFAVVLTLREGANAIAVTLLSGRDVIASSSYTVVLNRTPPTLAVTRPLPGGSVVGPTFLVEGKTEPGATVTVNDHTVVPAPDGTFGDTVTVSAAAPFTVTVVATDRAGNTTTQRVPVTVTLPASPIPATVTVSLDRVKVRPSETVTANISVRDASGAKADVLVTLSVGVIPIGSTKTDNLGNAQISFAAPTTEGEISVVVLAVGGSGRATLTVAK